MRSENQKKRWRKGKDTIKAKGKFTKDPRKDIKRELKQNPLDIS